MRQREERIAKTESLFRDVNERIAEASERFESEDAQFVCECGEPTCAERLEVPLEDYEQVRDDPTTFVLNPEHVKSDVEKVVREERGYAVVRKIHGGMQRIVRALDPRAEPA
jgi:hypothetical protein